MIATVWFDLSVVWVSIGLSFVAAVSMGFAAVHGFPEKRPAYTAGALLALMYCGSYVWLAFNFERAATWSQYLRPVGMVSWLAVWTAPALMSVGLYRKLRKAAAGVGEDEDV